MCLCAALLVLTLTTANKADAETVEEKFDNGQIKLRYEVAGDQKHGDYEEFYDDGTPRVKAKYKKGKLDGKHITYFNNGQPHIESTYKREDLNGKYLELDIEGQKVLSATFAAGKLNGKRTVYEDGKPVSEQVWTRDELTRLHGQRAHSRSRKQLENALRKFFSSRITMPGATKDQAMALRRLNAHRYLCGASADVRLDQKRTGYSQAATKLFAMNKATSGNVVTNPGLPEEEYKRARTGAGRSLMVIKPESSAESVDSHMFNAHKDNARTVDGRMWCLSPKMGLTGFGRTNDYFAMYKKDETRKPNGKWKMVSFPPPGYLPVDYVGNRGGLDRTPLPWCVALNPKHFSCSANFSVDVRPLDEELREGKPLEIIEQHFVVARDLLIQRGELEGSHKGSSKSSNNNTAGQPRRGIRIQKDADETIGGYVNWYVFKPQGVRIQAGQRYWVRLRGVKTAQGRPTRIEYLVEFIEPVQGATIGDANGDAHHGKRKPSTKPKRRPKASSK